MSDGPARRDWRAELTSHEMRERYRSQMLAGIGGWSGMAVAALPTVVFVAINAWQGLRPGVIAALGAVVLLVVYRVIRKQPIQQALSGVLGVVIAAVIAGATGQARNYFLWGILTSFVYGVALVISMLVRRPIIGLIWEFLDPIEKRDQVMADDETAARVATSEPSGEFPSRHSADNSPLAGADGSPAVPAADAVDGPPAVPWYRRRVLLAAYQWATAAGVVVFFARGFVQLALYLSERTGWLAVARIVMGYPLWAVAAVFVVWTVRRARRRAGTLVPSTPTS